MSKLCVLLAAGVFLCLETSPGVGQSITASYINGIVQADQFTGADMCQKINNAANSVLGADTTLAPVLVDATHFTGTQACGYNMFASLVTPGSGNPGTVAPGNTTLNLAITFGAVTINTTVQQHLVNSGVALIGLDPYVTKLAYTGTSADAQGVLYVDGTTGVSPYNGGLIGFILHGFFIYGNSHVTDALQMVSTHRSKVEHVDLWGVTGDCVHTLGAVTDTFTSVHCSVSDAFQNGLQGGIYPYPTNGKHFTNYGGTQTTNGSVIDAMDEGVTGTGWYLQSASQMHFSAGTSEGNGYGVAIAAGSKFNAFTTPDIESNTANVNGVDWNDQGQGTVIIAPIFDSTCTGGCTHNAIAGGGGGQYIIIEAGAEESTTFSGFSVIGNASNFYLGAGTVQAGPTNVTAIYAPILSSTSAAPVVYPGTGISSATCADESGDAPACTSSRGTIKIVNSSATTTSSFVELIWASTLASKPSCQITQAGGTATNLGLWVSAVSTTALYIANTASLSGIGTFYIAYQCQL
jgi:hypothetical protein